MRISICCLFGSLLLIAGCSNSGESSEQNTGNDSQQQLIDSSAHQPPEDSTRYVIRTESEWQGTDHSVLGYYLNVPGMYLVSYDGGLLLEGQSDSRENRIELIKQTRGDDYLKLESNKRIKVWEGWVDLALYRDASGDTIFSESYYSCGPGCNAEVTLLKYYCGAWIEVTDSIFQLPAREELAKLYSKATGKKDAGTPDILLEPHPDKGTLLVICDPQFENNKRIEICTYDFKRGHFVLRK